MTGPFVTGRLREGCVMDKNQYHKIDYVGHVSKITQLLNLPQ